MTPLLTELRALLAAPPDAPALRDLAGRLHAEPGCRWLAQAVAAYEWALALPPHPRFGSTDALGWIASRRKRVETELEMTA